MDFYCSQNVVGWTVSEKLDGVFARWGASLFTRDWVLMQAPAALTAGLDPCEGELVHDDGLERVQGCRQWGRDDARWQGVRFVPHLAIPSEVVTSADHARRFYGAVVARGGEGVVLRSPEGVLLKWKPSQDDEAEVIGYTPGSGRNPGIGSLCLLWGDVAFKLSVGLSNRDRLDPPAIGSLVTFSFDCPTAKGVPRGARFMRRRVAA